jgi:hypothetical protein
MGLIFLYDVRLVPNANPRKRNDEFSHALARFFQTIGLDYLMSGQGGAGTTRGIAYRKEGDATQQDRERVGEFIRQQPISATARIGDLEQDTESTNYFRPVTEWEIEVDNLTDAERAEAAAYHEEIRLRFQSFQEKYGTTT